jgi:hypothetical protein
LIDTVAALAVAVSNTVLYLRSETGLGIKKIFISTMIYVEGCGVKVGV